MMCPSASMISAALLDGNLRAVRAGQCSADDGLAPAHHPRGDGPAGGAGLPSVKKTGWRIAPFPWPRGSSPIAPRCGGWRRGPPEEHRAGSSVSICLPPPPFPSIRSFAASQPPPGAHAQMSRTNPCVLGECSHSPRPAATCHPCAAGPLGRVGPALEHHRWSGRGARRPWGIGRHRRLSAHRTNKAGGMPHH
jgi:hypothetical protein